jgi:putative ABC transport system permease protein
MNRKKEDAPPFALRFLEWFCPRELYEGIEGDLVEQFESDRRELGERTAKRKLMLNAVRFFRPGIFLRNRFSVNLNQTAMFRNYLRVMFRTMKQRKVHSAITIFGLTVGIAFSMLIGIFVREELRVNADLRDADRLYIIENSQKEGDLGPPFMIPSPAAKAIKEYYPLLVEDYYRFWDRGITVSKGDKHFRIQSLMGDSTLITMFGFSVLYGDPKTALIDHYSIVITKQIALRYFGRVDVAGETLTLKTEAAGDREYTITAILDDLSRNSVSNLLDINAQIFLPIENGADFGNSIPDLWNGVFMISYIKLTPSASLDDVRKALSKIMHDHAPENVKDKMTLEPLPLSSYYLLTNDGAVKKLLVTLTSIGAFILLMAVINFVTITIGSSTVRLKEIGIRKAIGGIRKQIIFQFLTESLALAFAAMILSLLLYELLRPSFNDILAAALPRITTVTPEFWWWLGAGVLAVGLLAGSYPAFLLSSYRTVESLKGKLKPMRGSLTFSRSLIAVQFLLAICVFTFSIIISRQVAYFLEKDLGYDKSSVLTVSSVPRLWSEEGINAMEAAKQEFLTSPVISHASLSWEIPNENYGNSQALYKEGSQEQDAVPMPMLMTDEDFASTYQLVVTEGKFFFGKGETWQAGQLVINESAQRILGVGVGDKVSVRNSTSSFTIAGIVKDFNFFSLRQSIQPLAFVHTRDARAFRYFSFKLNPGNLAASVETVHAKWKEVFPNDPFEFNFMDERLEKLYKTELQLKKASTVATALMLIIVLLGVLGLASLSVSRRTKEIGIRKVLGASVSTILALLSHEYLKIMLIAFAAAVPVTYYLTDQWLSGFAYHIAIQWWMLVMPGLLVLLATVLVVCGQAFRTALANPTETLRHE